MVMVPSRVAALIDREMDMHALRIRARANDPEVYEVLLSLHEVALAWRSSAVAGTEEDTRPEPKRGLEQTKQLTSTEAADHLGVTDRAIRKAIHEGRLAASKTGSKWLIDREELAHFKTRRKSR